MGQNRKYEDVGAELITNVNGIETVTGKIRAVLKKENYRKALSGSVEGSRSIYPLMVKCTEELAGVLHEGGEALHKLTRVTDGYLIPIGKNEWCRLVGDVGNFYGFVLYNNRHSKRVILNQSTKRCGVQQFQVEVVRGGDGVCNRLGSTA